MAIEHGSTTVHYVDQVLAKGPNPPQQEGFSSQFKRRISRYQPGGYYRKDSYSSEIFLPMQARITTKEENPEKAEKGWYAQSGPTCGAWATINAAYYITEAPFSPQQTVFFRQLHDSASTNGISIKRIARIAKDIPDLGLRVTTSTDLYAFPDMETLIIISPYSNRLNKLFAHNVAVIARIIDEGGSIVLPINSDKFGYHRFDTTGHGIAVVDYRVFEDGMVEGCIIDPNYGKVWVPMEDIFVAYRGPRKRSYPFEGLVERLRYKAQGYDDLRIEEGRRSRRNLLGHEPCLIISKASRTN